MSHKERILLAMMNGCHVSVDGKNLPPNDAIELVGMAVQRGMPITIREANHLAPSTLQTVVVKGGGLLRLEF